MSMRTIPVRLFALLFCAFIGLLPAGAQMTVYRSNGLGMALEKLASYMRDEHEFVLEVDKKPGSEVRRLYRNGSEVRRWETAASADGKKRENEYEGALIIAARIFGPSDELQREDTYRDGELFQRAVYEYVKGSPSGVKVTDADGNLVYRDEFRLSSRGSLREVRRTYPDGARASSAVFGGSSVGGEERDELSGVTIVIRYDERARAVEKEQWKGEKLLTLEKFVFRGDTDLLSESTEDWEESGRHIERAYNEQGRLLIEKTAVGGEPTEQTDYTWNADGLNTEKRRRGPEGIEEWLYSYAADREKTLEEYFLRGSLVKRTQYAEKGERSEDFFREGEMFLRVFYSSDVKTKEQVYEDGVLVRERSFE